jgi:hypothetical protein
MRLAPGPSSDSQFGSPIDRAHMGKARIKSRLTANADSDECEFPPKPRWMRGSVYDQLVRRFNAYEAELDAGIAVLARSSRREPW